MIDNNWHKKEKPMLTMGGMGGGAFQQALLSSGVTLGNRSLRFTDTSTYLNRTPSSTTNRTTWTWSGWVKRCGDTSRDSLFRASTGGSDYTLLKFRGTGGGQDYRISLDQYGGDNFYVYTDAVFRDFSAWYHVVCAVDTTQGVSNNRVRIYVNGVEQSLQTSTNFPGDSINTNMNDSNHVHYISYNSGTNVMNGLITDVHFVDGSQLTPGSFGAADSNGVWQRSTYSGSYGTNGFHLLDFANDGTIGNDTSGNGNNFTANGFSEAAGSGNDVLFDFPTNDTENTDSGAGGEVIGNYCVFNSLNKGNDVTLSNGNLQAATTSSPKDGVFGSIGVSSGKYYWEVELTSADGNTNAAIGVALGSLSPDAASPTSAGAYFYSSYNGNKWLSSADSSYGDSYTTGDIIGVALDLDNSTLAFYKNGVSQGNATTSLPSGTYFPYVGDNANNAAQTVVANWGQREFSHSAPTNHKCLTTTSLPTPTIADGSDYFDIDLYTGTGSTHERSEFSFSPDLVWIKQRNTTRNNLIFDTIRGANKFAVTNSSGVPGTGTGMVTSFDSDGFTLGNSDDVNQSSGTFCAWCWDAGSSTVSNTNGNFTTNVRANTTAGFSIVQAPSMTTGTKTLGHGLGDTPDMIWIKRASGGSEDWYVYHSALGTGKQMRLNQTNAVETTTSFGTVNSSVFSYDPNTGDHIAFCFKAIESYSAFGTYEGNNDADGPFLNLGFRPAFFFVKNADATQPWNIYDSSRDIDNVVTTGLQPNNNNAEYSTTDRCDFLSNGIKIRSSGGTVPNLSGNTYIYAAFAENPFQANGGIAR